MILSLSFNHIIIVVLIFTGISVLIIFGIYSLIKRAVRKGTAEAIENNKTKS